MENPVLPPHIDISIPITDNHDEMEKIGRQIFSDNPSIYAARIIEVMNRQIDRMMPTASDEEKESFFYRSIYDYWVYGASIGEDLSYDFSDKTHDQKMEYMLMRLKSIFCSHLNNKQKVSNLLTNKYNTYKLLKEYYHREVILIENENDFDKFLKFVESHPVFVIKPVNFSVGLYIRKVSVADYKNPRELFDEILTSIDTVADDTSRNALLTIHGKVSMLLEELIEQAPEMKILHPQSVNSLRINTIRINGQIRIVYPVLKIAQGNSFVDNGRAGGLFAAINLETGIVETNLFTEYENRVKSLEKHPDTGIKSIGFQISRWQEALDLARTCAEKFDDDINYIGWDIALTSKGWCIVEGNGYSDPFIFYQLILGRGIKKDLEDLIGWKLPNKFFWWQ